MPQLEDSYFAEQLSSQIEDKLVDLENLFFGPAFTKDGKKTRNKFFSLANSFSLRGKPLTMAERDRALKEAKSSMIRASAIENRLLRLRLRLLKFIRPEIHEQLYRIRDARIEVSCPPAKRQRR